MIETSNFSYMVHSVVVLLFLAVPIDKAIGMGIGGAPGMQVEYRYRIKKGAVTGNRRSQICFS